MFQRLSSIALLCGATALCCANVPVSFAQAPAAAPQAPAAAPTMSSPSQSLDAVQNLIEKDWMGLADAMPADKYSFAPSVDDFQGGSLKPDYTGVRTFGQEVAHVAQANFAFAAYISGSPMPANMKEIGTAFDKESARANLAASFTALHKAIAGLTAENAWMTVKGPGNTRAGTVAYNFGHQRDHYGQLVEYLRMCGMVPPASQGAPLANPGKKS